MEYPQKFEHPRRRPSVTQFGVCHKTCPDGRHIIEDVISYTQCGPGQLALHPPAEKLLMRGVGALYFHVPSNFWVPTLPLPPQDLLPENDLPF